MGQNLALVHDFIFTWGGAERVLAEVHQMYPEAPIYTAYADLALVEKYLPGADVRTSYLQNSWKRSFPPLVIGEMPQAIESFKLDEYDTVISLSGAFSHGIITQPRTKHVCYCHTPMRYAWDWHVEYLQEKGWSSGVRQWIAEYQLKQLRQWDYLSSKRVDVWLANSQTVADRIKRYYQAQPEVLFPPVHSVEVSKSNKQPSGEYAVVVSRLSKYKNIDVLIEACNGVMPLVVIGKGDDLTRLKSLAGKDVHFYQDLSDTERSSLVQGAKWFLYASEEDFGIATAEALILGTPVIGLGKAGTAEQVNDGKNGFLAAKAGAALYKPLLSQQASWSKEEIIADATARFSAERFTKRLAEILAS